MPAWGDGSGSGTVTNYLWEILTDNTETTSSDTRPAVGPMRSCGPMARVASLRVILLAKATAAFCKPLLAFNSRAQINCLPIRVLLRVMAEMAP